MTTAKKTPDLELENLVEGLKKGDALALATFQEKYGPRILGWARQFVRSEWDAEEVVQDVMWTIHRKADTFRGESGFLTWVYRVTLNAARMKLRKNKRVPALIGDDAVMAMVDRSGDLDQPARPDEQMDAWQSMGRLHRALEELSPENKALFLALDLQGSDREDVARSLNLSMPALKARLHRVRQNLRLAFAPA
jgi:RNA polymerase sigma-70 factor (ECF subfamily)